MRRVVCLITLFAFLFTNCGFASKELINSRPSGSKLAPAIISDDMNPYSELSGASIYLAANLSFLGERIGGAESEEVIKNAFRKNGFSYSERHAVTIYSEEVEHINGHAFKVPVSIERNGRRYDFQLAFSSIRNSDGFFPVTLYVPPKQPKLIIMKDAGESAKWIAREIIDEVKKNPATVLGFATGETPIPVYKEIVRLTEEEKINWSGVITFNLDEYLGLSPRDNQSYRHFMNEHLFNALKPHGLKLANTHLPNGLAKDPKKAMADYAKKIRAAGGVQLWLIGIGSDGHYAFLEPAAAISMEDCAILAKDGDRIDRRTALFKKIRDFNEFMISPNTAKSYDAVKNVAIGILGHQSIIRNYLGSCDDLVTRLMKSSLISSRPLFDPQITDELDRLGKRMLEGSEITLYVSLPSKECLKLQDELRQNYKNVNVSNEGEYFKSSAKVVSLALPTLIDNSRLFAGVNEVPLKALTATGVVRESSRIIQAVMGRSKARALLNTLNLPATPECPSTILTDHPDYTVVASEAAAASVAKQPERAEAPIYGKNGMAHVFGKMRDASMWMPLISFGGVKHFNAATGKNYTVEELATDPQKQFEVVKFMQDLLRLNVSFTMMDLSNEAEAVSAANRDIGALPVTSVFQEKHVDQEGALFGKGFEFTKENIGKLKLPVIGRHGRMHVFTETARKLKDKFGDKVAKAGYVIGPWTLAMRLLGNGNDAVLTALDNPDEFMLLLEYCTQVSVLEAEAFADAGADAVIILEPSSAFLNPRSYSVHITGPVNKVIDSLHNKNVAAIFHGCADSSPFLGQMAELNADAFSLDDYVDMNKAYKALTAKGAYIIGNIKSSQMGLKTADELAEEAEGVLAEFGRKPNFLLGITCEMPFDTPIDNILAVTSANIRHNDNLLEKQNTRNSSSGAVQQNHIFLQVSANSVRETVDELYYMAGNGVTLEDGTVIAASEIFRLIMNSGKYGVDTNRSEMPYSGTVRDLRVSHDLSESLETLNISLNIHKEVMAIMDGDKEIVTDRYKKDMTFLLESFPAILRGLLEDLMPRIKRASGPLVLNQFFRLHDGTNIVPKIKKQHINLRYNDLVLSVGIDSNAKISVVDILPLLEANGKRAYSISHPNGRALSVDYKLSASEKLPLISLFGGDKTVKTAAELKDDLRNCLDFLEKVTVAARAMRDISSAMKHFNENKKLIDDILAEVRGIASDLGLGLVIKNMEFPSSLDLDRNLERCEGARQLACMEITYYRPIRKIAAALRASISTAPVPNQRNSASGAGTATYGLVEVDEPQEVEIVGWFMQEYIHTKDGQKLRHEILRLLANRNFREIVERLETSYARIAKQRSDITSGQFFAEEESAMREEQVKLATMCYAIHNYGLKRAEFLNSGEFKALPATMKTDLIATYYLWPMAAPMTTFPSVRKSASGYAAVDDLLNQAREAMPDQYYNNGMNVSALIKDLTDYSEKGIRALPNTALVFSEEVTFKNGLGILLPKLARAGVNIAVVATSDTERHLVDRLNQSIADDKKKIVCGSSIEEISRIPGIAKFYYFRLDDEADPSIRNVVSIPITVEYIVSILGKVCNIVNAPQLEMIETARKLFAQAA
ncbi:MAG: uroporphyrinogen decarboxylase family protein [Candidatus Omnitrophota bacterium]|nr:uroporphyrinogen decarboxylase family protein [Candidatus Omnitrophota bacterium]